MKFTFFWGNTSGLKADIERHRAKEKDLLDKIKSLEGKDDPMSNATRKVYFRFLDQLHQSKAEVLTQLGRK